MTYFLQPLNSMSGAIHQLVDHGEKWLTSSSLHTQPLRHWRMLGVEYHWMHVPPGSNSLFQEYFQMEATPGRDQIEFPVYPHGNLCISINFQEKRTRAYLFGLNKSTWSGVLTGGESVFGGSFAAGDVFTILGVPGIEMTDQIIDMEDIWPRHTRLLIRLMEQAASMQERIPLLESFFTHFRNETRERNPLVQTVLQDLYSTPSTPIHEIAHRQGISRRHLCRLFAHHVGLSPKNMSRLYRLIILKTTLLQTPDTDLSYLCHSLGYYDQAHFNKEFKQHFGATPSRYIKNGMDLS